MPTSDGVTTRRAPKPHADTGGKSTAVGQPSHRGISEDGLEEGIGDHTEGVLQGQASNEGCIPILITSIGCRQHASTIPTRDPATALACAEIDGFSASDLPTASPSWRLLRPRQQCGGGKEIKNIYITNC